VPDFSNQTGETAAALGKWIVVTTDRRDGSAGDSRGSV
jgi:hypothetical protein